MSAIEFYLSPPFIIIIFCFVLDGLSTENIREISEVEKKNILFDFVLRLFH